MTHWRQSNQSAGQPHSPIARSLAGRPHAAPSFIKPPFERSQVAQALLDIGAAGIFVAFWLFLVLFVRL